jgi:hypothetical protein
MTFSFYYYRAIAGRFLINALNATSLALYDRPQQIENTLDFSPSFAMLAIALALLILGVLQFDRSNIQHGS